MNVHFDLPALALLQYEKWCIVSIYLKTCQGKLNFFKISPTTFIKNILKVKINNGLSEEKNQFYEILSIFF